MIKVQQVRGSPAPHRRERVVCVRVGCNCTYTHTYTTASWHYTVFPFTTYLNPRGTLLNNFLILSTMSGKVSPLSKPLYRKLGNLWVTFYLYFEYLCEVVLNISKITVNWSLKHCIAFRMRHRWPWKPSSMSKQFIHDHKLVNYASSSVSKLVLPMGIILLSKHCFDVV